MFRKVLMSQSNDPAIAKVNRRTGILFLNAKIWDRLPTDQKDFVLFHEEGHLRLQTADEFKANSYAIGKFIPAGKFSNSELGKRIVVMREILNKADETSNFSIGNAVSGVFQNLTILGIGSKARQKETEAAAAANVAVINAQTEQTAAKTRVFVLIGVIAIVLTVSFLILRKK